MASLSALAAAMAVGVAQPAASQTTAAPSGLATPPPATAPSAQKTDSASSTAVGVTPDRGNPGIQDIIVTAQKREQSLNDVGMSITALGAAELSQRGVSHPEDLVRVVPSLTVTKTRFDVPIYTLRGIGFFENSLSAASTISLYGDQVPYAFPIMARGASLDLERVEVLKGPQGTVFGSNTTGGLVNFIAARPTDTLSAGVGVSVARFGQVDADAFISGPLTDGLTGRLSGATTQGGAWQRSATRGDELGDQRFTRGRLILDARPTGSLKLVLTVNGWIDHSDTQAPEAVDPVNPVNGEPFNPILTTSEAIQQTRATDARNADWDVGTKFQRHDWFIQPSLRADLDLSSTLTLTTITEYSHLKRDSLNDGDGTPAVNSLSELLGSIDDVFQELRVAGNSFGRRLHWTVGGDYQHDIVHDTNSYQVNADAGGLLLPGLGAFPRGAATSVSRIRTLAAYASADYDLSRRVTLTGGVRYTSTDTDYVGCTTDVGDGKLSGILDKIQIGLLKVAPTATPGQCVTVQDDPTKPGLYTTGNFVSSLDQDNVSWRGGVNWKPLGNETLLYANVSRGYKAGSYPTTSANIASQLKPVTQERLTAYEVGFKAPVGGRTLQVNGAAFYYAYQNKQIRGRVVTLFGQLEELLNIPRSRIWGLELQGTLRPFRGLTANASATYINSRILNDPDGTPFRTFPARDHASNALIPLTGQDYPFTPRYSATGDLQYDWSLSARYRAFVGTAVTFQSRTKTTLTPADPSRPTDISATSTTTFNDPVFSLPPYALLDLRAGIASRNGPWHLTVWGRNVTNKYYLTSVTKAQDTIARYTGYPASYGVTIGWRL